ncbi:hypothetical protein LRAMOSA01784 [Lichtheimia ramosa]|uniref:Uncharacterized protein n=1 Tax=Lichtheimia ramosa TaxID=688394 RepID=A0A077WKA5_9FUNG|nr:hypothetical protein LRAMOSA01784 [Lichtheimia ramosa]
MSSISSADSFHFSIQDGDQVFESAAEYLSAACIAQWLQKSPTAKATLFMDDGDQIDVPVYTLRRRNAVVADLPEAPSLPMTA